MTIYTFNEDAHRVVGKSALAFEKRPINAVPPKRERKNIAKGGVAISEHPFKVEEDGQNLSIGGGKITVSEYDGSGETEYGIPSEVLDLTSIESSTTIYVYSKLPVNRENGNDYLSKPTLTVGVSNASFNGTLFPNADLTNYFSPIAIVDITIVDDVKSFAINQIEFENKNILGSNIHSWRLNAIYNTKGSDTSADTQYKYFLSSGNITTPEGTQTLSSESGLVGVNNRLLFYARTTASTATDGYKENYNTTIGSGNITSIPPNSTQLGVITNGSITQNRNEDIASDGTVV